MKLLRLAAWTLWFTLSWIALAHADPISGIVAAIGTFLASGTALANLALSAILTVAKIGLSLLQKAKQGNQQAGVSSDMQFGGDNPLSFVVGTFATPGQLEYANTWGKAHKTQNAYITHVISAGDLPMAISGLWGDDKKVTLPDMSGAAPTEQGWPVADFQSGSDYLWVKLLDGTQTATDPLLLSKFVSDPDRPIISDMIWRGVPLLIVTARFNQKLWNGIPQYLVETTGIPLYDPRKDTSVGGSGTHRWNDWSTWEPSDNPIVQAYNILRGIYYEGEFLWGGRCEAWQLPLSNWFAAMNASETLVDLADGGQEKQFRSGLEITVDQEPAEIIETILKGCNGRFAEVGGIYKVHVGAPGAAVYSFTDETIVVTEGQSLDPFPGLEQTVNGAQASYPEPAEKWAAKDAPAYLRADLEVLDDNRQLVTGLQYPSVPYAVQVQRLLQAAVEDARRFKVHQFVLPPEAWLLEPNDVVAWTSVRNGYVEKKFIVTEIEGDSNFLQYVTLKEVDPSDYSWNPATDQQPYSVGPLGPIVPPAQEFAGWAVEQYTFTDAAGNGRRPGILVKADGDLDDVEFIRVQVRKAGTTATVYDQVYPYGDPITNPDPIQIPIEFSGILPNENYEARGLLEPITNRDTEWSDWLAVTTPDIRLGGSDIYPIDLDQLADEVRDLQEWTGNAVRDVLEELRAVSAWAANQELSNFSDKQQLRTELHSESAGITAAFTDAILVATGPSSALSQRITTLEATIPSLATASAVTALSTTVSAQGATISSQGSAITALQNAVNDPSTGLEATADAVSSLGTTVASQGDAITLNADAITALQASYGDVSAGATFRMGVGYTPDTGWDSRIGLETRVNSGGTFRSAGLFLESTADEARIILDADQVAVVADDVVAALFASGTTFIDNARIKNLTAANIIADKLDAAEVLQNGTLITDLIAFNAITESIPNELTTTTIPGLGTTWQDVQTTNIPDRDVATPIDLSFVLNVTATSGGSGTNSNSDARIIRRDSGGDTEIPGSLTSVVKSGSGTANASSGPSRILDNAPAEAFQYIVQARNYRSGVTAVTSGTVTAQGLLFMWWKR